MLKFKRLHIILLIFALILTVQPVCAADSSGLTEPLISEQTPVVEHQSPKISLQQLADSQTPQPQPQSLVNTPADEPLFENQELPSPSSNEHLLEDQRPADPQIPSDESLFSVQQPDIIPAVDLSEDDRPLEQPSQTPTDDLSEEKPSPEQPSQTPTDDLSEEKPSPEQPSQTPTDDLPEEEHLPKQPLTEPPTPEQPLEQQPAEKYLITDILNLASCTNPILMACGDTEKLSSEIEHWTGMFSFMVGIPDDEEADGAQLTLKSFDASGVDIQVPGEYEINVQLKLDESAFGWQNYELPEEISTFNITVYVADLDKFRLFTTGTSTPAKIAVTWLYPVDNELPLEILYTSAGTLLNEEGLNTITWQTCTDESFAAAEKNLVIFRSALKHDTHYYFRLKQGELISDILHIFDDGNTIVSNSMEGNRDGGDILEPPNNDIIVQPSPPRKHKKPTQTVIVPEQTEPAETINSASQENEQPDTALPNDPAQDGTLTENTLQNPSATDSHIPVSGSVIDKPQAETTPEDSSQKQDTTGKTPTAEIGGISGIGSASPDGTSGAQNSATAAADKNNEIVTPNSTKISGARLSYLLDNYDEWIPFAHNDISIQLSAEYLQNLDLSDTSFLTVEINRTETGFTFDIRINDEKITLTDKAKVACLLHDDSVPDTLWYNGEKLPSKVSCHNGVAYFDIEQTGSYRLSAENESAAASNAISISSSYQLMKLLMVIIFAGLLLALLLHRKGLAALWKNRKNTSK